MMFMSNSELNEDRRCVAHLRVGPLAGQRCPQPAFIGTTVCMKHGAHLPVVQKAAHETVAEARMHLVLHAGDAAAALLDLMNNASSDAVRAKAAESVLDRVGVRGGSELHVSTDDSKARAAEIIAERLDKLRGAGRPNPVTEPVEPVFLELEGAQGEPLEGELLPPAGRED